MPDLSPALALRRNPAVRVLVRATALTLVAGVVLTIRPPVDEAPLLRSKGTAAEVHSVPLQAAAARALAGTKSHSQLRSLAQEPAATGPEAQPEAGKELVAQVDADTTDDYKMLGVTWDDPTAGADLQVMVRTKGEHGWTSWTELHNDAEEGPAPGEEPGGRGGTEPLWVGESTGVQVRVFDDGHAAPRGVRVDLVDPGTLAQTPAPMAYSTPASQPRIITRQQWGANESWGDTCWQPRYANAVHAVFIHHTAGTNSYSAAQSAGIVRGIYSYHTQSRGWCDIGYNFLVDRYGNIYEGRRGGIDKPVRGSHAGEANLGSVGISLMGNFQDVAPTWAMKNAVVDLVSWEVGSRYLDPLGSTTELPDQPYNKNGQPFAVISGHRDAMYTACPGQRVYNWLPTLRRQVAERLAGSSSPIERRWERLGGERSWLGAPFIGERPDGAGASTVFDHATMYASAATPPRSLLGAIRWRYDRIGGTGSFLGFPTSDERATGVSNGRFNHFQRGGIYWSAGTGSHWVFAAINGLYNHLGGAVALGMPVTDEVDAPVAGARMSGFERSEIYWSRGTGTHAVYGAIRGIYNGLGGSAGLGLPIADEEAGPVAGSRQQRFQRSEIYWSRSTGAHSVYGAVRGAYNGVGGAAELGLPVSNEYDAPEGRQQDFVNGSILWNRTTRQTTITMTDR
ncbi:MAG TPA: N-acetylmuramoyl-L-alanine amidase [Marmoricola sp.]|jgi:uncharacterized protein with LGFP repeats|nr:N-acetylmuramoyl-L-alanine amidase [Marmoricola sp.]